MLHVSVDQQQFCFTCLLCSIKKPLLSEISSGKRTTADRFPVVAPWLWTWLVSMKMRVWSLASLSRLRIQCCGGCGVGSSCPSNLTPSLGTFICQGCSPKKKFFLSGRDQNISKSFYWKLHVTSYHILFVKKKQKKPHTAKPVSSAGERILCLLQKRDCNSHGDGHEGKGNG